MKILSKNYRNLFLCMLALIIVLAACKKEEDVLPKVRLFRPVQISDMFTSGGNWLKVNWSDIKEAKGYLVELSRDSFATTPIATAQVDTSFVLFQNLLWNTIYQVQVTALADDPQYNSEPSFLGSAKTAKFPSVLTAPGPNDVTDVAAKVMWTNSGATLTSIQVKSATDTSLVKEVPLTEEDLAAQVKIVQGLQANTSYLIYMYSGDAIRGWEPYTTKAPVAVGDVIVDLRGFDNPTVLKDTLPNIEDGAVVILERGMTYDMTSSKFSKSVKIVSGLGFADVAVLEMGSSSGDIDDGSTIDTIQFKELSIKGVFASGYVMNWSTTGSLNALIFENCRIQSLRGIFRMKNSGSINVNSFTIDNCMVDSIRDYGVINMDNSNAVVDDITFKNSTFYNIYRVVRSKTNSNSLTISDCTFYQMTVAGSYFVEMRSDTEFAEMVKIYNCVFGPGWDPDATGSTDFRAFRAGPNTALDIKNTYVTSDFISTSYMFSPEPMVYGGTAKELFADPDNGDFTFIDSGFGGSGSCGDPRWRTGL